MQHDGTLRRFMAAALGVWLVVAQFCVMCLAPEVTHAGVADAQPVGHCHESAPPRQSTEPDCDCAHGTLPALQGAEVQPPSWSAVVVEPALPARGGIQTHVSEATARAGPQTILALSLFPPELEFRVLLI